MKVFLIDNNKIIKYMLPLKIDETFSINYNTSEIKDCLITFEGINGKWYLTSNGTVTIIEGNQKLDRTAVETYKKYTLKVVGKADLIEIYFLPAKETLFKLDFTKSDNFSVGNSDTCHICYKSSDLTEIQALFKAVGEDWIVSAVNDDNYKIYINNARATLKKLKPGDVIFIGGLKIIWMSNFIYVNNPRNILRITGMKLIQDKASELKGVSLKATKKTEKIEKPIEEKEETTEKTATKKQTSQKSTTAKKSTAKTTKETKAKSTSKAKTSSSEKVEEEKPAKKTTAKTSKAKSAEGESETKKTTKKSTASKKETK